MKADAPKKYQCARCLGDNLVFDPLPTAPNFEYRANCMDCEDDVPVMVQTPDKETKHGK